VTKKTRNTLVNTKQPLGTLEGHFAIYGVYAGLSSNSGVWYTVLICFPIIARVQKVRTAFIELLV